MRDLPMDQIVDLCRLALQFGRTDRVTLYPDGTPESDTDHTVMLGLVACAYAEQYAPHLNLGLIAQFSIVHDLPEAICGDTNTLKASAAKLAAKEEREREAAEEIYRRTTSLPWVAATLQKYERLDSPEARFVKVVDKVLPKITHMLNGGMALRQHGVDFKSLGNVNGSQRQKLASSYGADQPAAMELLLAAHEMLVQALTAGGFGAPS